MHLLYENTIPNLISLWCGTIKGITGDYVINEATWAIIGAETAAAVKTIPSAFVGHLPDIATDQGLYKAEFYAFWFTYLASILLRGRFKAPKYYTHMCDLVWIIKTCLQFQISDAEIAELKRQIRVWVIRYEEWVTRLEYLNMR